MSFIVSASNIKMYISVTHRDTQNSQVFRPESSKQTKTNESVARVERPLSLSVT